MVFPRRAFVVVVVLGAGLAACGLDVVGAKNVETSAIDASVDAPRDTERESATVVDAAALDAETSVSCPSCPNGFTCALGVCTDRAVAHFTLAANPSGNWTWAYHDFGAPIGAVIAYTSSHVETTQGGIQVWSRDPSSVTPAVFFNPGAAVVHPYGTFTLEPGELGFHPGALNENSVVRWTAPEANAYSATISLRGLAGYMGGPPTTTGITILKATTVIGNTQLTASATSAVIDVSAMPFAAGEALDVRVDFGSNGNFMFDSTGVDVVVRAP